MVKCSFPPPLTAVNGSVGYVSSAYCCTTPPVDCGLHGGSWSRSWRFYFSIRLSGKIQFHGVISQGFAKNSAPRTAPLAPGGQPPPPVKQRGRPDPPPPPHP